MIWFQYTDVLYPCERCCTMLTFHFPSFHHSPTSTPTLRTGTRSSPGSPRTSSRPPSTPAWYSTSFTLALISDRSLLSSDLLGKINLSELGQRPAGKRGLGRFPPFGVCLAGKHKQDPNPEGNDPGTDDALCPISKG